jgi:hypothetical protein
VVGAEPVVWTHQLNIANGGHHADRRIARDAGVDDRLLVVYRLGDADCLHVTAQTARQVVMGPRRPLFHGLFVTTREVWVDTDPPLALDLDGEVRGRTPVRMTLLPQALRVLVPRASPTPDPGPRPALVLESERKLEGKDRFISSVSLRPTCDDAPPRKASTILVQGGDHGGPRSVLPVGDRS